MEFLCLVLLVFMWCYTVLSFGYLPDKISTHFNLPGKVTSMGNKSSIYVLPVVGMFIYLLLTVIARYPYTHNYTVKVTPQNALALYTVSCRLLLFIKLIVLGMFCFILQTIIRPALQYNFNLFPYIFPAFLIGLWVIIILYILKMNKLKD